MATDRNFHGFEGGLIDGDLVTLNDYASVFSDGTARSGDFYLVVQSPTVSALGYLDAVSAASHSIADGESYKVLSRFFLRLKRYPSASGCLFGGVGRSTENWRGGIILDTTGHVAAKAHTTDGTYSTYALPIGTWVRVTITYVLQNLPASANNQLDVTVAIATEAGAALTSATVQHVGSTALAYSTPALGGINVNTIKCADYDDWTWMTGSSADAAAVALPTASRITPALATAQGASAGWTGAWQRATEVPRSATAADEQTTTTDEASTTFAHDTAAALGIDTIAAVKVVASIKAASGGGEALLINGVEFAVTAPTSYATGNVSAKDYTAYSAGSFNALEFGVRNKRGVSTQVGSIWMEVLHEGNGISHAARIATAGSWKHVMGTYTGTGLDREITIGFRPDFVLVKKIDGFTSGGVIWTSKMGGANSHEIGSASFGSDLVVGATATGFKLGPNARVNDGTPRTYFYLAIRDGGQQSTGRFFAHGVYWADGLDDRTITIEDGFDPDVVMVSGSTSLIYRDRTFASGASMRFESSALDQTNAIQSFVSGGVVIGTAASVNSLNNARYFLAFKRGTRGLLDGFFAYGKFVATGGTQAVTGLQFAPDYVMADRPAAGDGAWRSSAVATQTGTISCNWTTNTTIAANGISSLTADGFTAGSQLAVSGETCYYLALALDGEVEPEEIEYDAGTSTIGLTWVEFTDQADVLHVSSKIALPDPFSYYGGFKEHRVTSWGPGVRALSDWLGQYEASTFNWVWSDTDRVIRGLLAGNTTKVFLNRPVTVRSIDDPNRRLLAVPRTLWKGIVRDYEQLASLEFAMVAKDQLAAKFSSENSVEQKPDRLVARADFADCPSTSLNRPVPSLYGDNSDGASATAPPVVTGTASRGAFTSGGFWQTGFGDLTSDAAIPTSPSASAAATGTLPADTYGVIVTAVDATGRESDPVPFYTDVPGDAFTMPAHMPQAAVNGTQRVNVSWTGSAGAAKYRVYLGHYYYGFRPVQYIEVTAPTVTCAFTAGPDRSTPATPSNITPGASVVQFAQFWYYTVSALMADGETALAGPDAFGITRAYRRELRLEWLTVAGALEYRVYRRGAAGTYDRRWIVPNTQTVFDDDLLDTGVTIVDGAPSTQGVVPLLPVGTRADVAGTIWYAFLLCGHAVKEITDLFQGGVKIDSGAFGVTVACPGKTGYATYFPNTGTTQYLDINSHRYTLVFERGPDGLAAADGTRPLTANVKGIETVGDSSGTLITDLLLQYRHAVINWLVQSYQAGPWLSAPLFPDDLGLAQVNEASFITAAGVASRRISGGYVGAWGLGLTGERQTIRDIVAQLNVSSDVDSGFNRKSQFFVRMADESVEVLAAAPLLSDVLDITDGTFRTRDLVGQLYNKIPYRFGRDYTGRIKDGWISTSSAQDDTSIGDLDETKTSPEILLYAVRNASQAADVIQRRLLRSKEPPRQITMDLGLQGLSIELGDVVRLTAVEGIGTNGYVLQPARIVRHTVDPEHLSVSLEAYDLGRLFTGAFPLGDETALASTWTTASVGEQIYGYLCDETTGLFSDGKPGKRLR